MEGFLRSIARPRPVVAVVLDPADVVAVAEHLKHVDLPSDPTWLLGKDWIASLMILLPLLRILNIWTSPIWLIGKNREVSFIKVP